MVKKINESEFAQVKDSKVALIDFSATWCGPCKMLSPVLEGVSEDFAGQVDFYNIDVDDNPEIAGEYDIQSIPALVILKNGVKADMSVGFKPKDAIEAWIRSNLD